jgi:hypothetical protein
MLRSRPRNCQNHWLIQRLIFPSRKDGPIKIDGFVKSPSAALRFNLVVAEGRGGSPSRPISGNPAGCPYHRICAPSPACGGRAFYKAIVSQTFYEIIKIDKLVKSQKTGFSVWRKPESSYFKAFWTPAFAGETTQKTFSEAIKISQGQNPHEKKGDAPR